MLPQSVSILFLLLLVGCGTLTPANHSAPLAERAEPGASTLDKSNDIVMYALGLIDTGYTFGGKNPSAGLDCSGMVSYIFAKAAGITVGGSAADIARQGHPVDLRQLRPGDLVFFNTRNKPFSHVGIYIGDDRFVHAPSEKGRVKTESLKNSYFAARLETARSLFN